MSRLFLPLCILLVVGAATVSAQTRRALDHSDYALWRTVSDEAISPDGNWAVWREAPDTVGDGRVVVKRTNGSTEYVIERGDNPRLIRGFVVALVIPPYDSTRQARIAGRKGDDLPKDSLIVLNLGNGQRSMFGPVRSFAVPEDGAPFFAYLGTTRSESKRDSTLAQSPHEKSDGHTVHLVSARSGDLSEHPAVTDYAFTKDGAQLVFSTETKSGLGDGVFAVATASREKTTLMEGEGFYRQLTLSDDGSKAAFLSNAADFSSDAPVFQAYVADLAAERSQAVVTAATQGLPDGWAPSEHGRLDFSDSGSRLYLNTAPRPVSIEEDKRPDDEKVAVDIWSWTDKDLMTVQLVNRNRDRERSYDAVLHLDSGKFVQLADASVESLSRVGSGDVPTVFGSDNAPYMPEGSWDTPGPRDVYAINVMTGARRRVLEGIRSGTTPSPDGKKLAWWDGEERVWKITTWTENPQSTVTASIAPPAGVRFENELHDSPSVPGSYGSAGWTSDGAWFLFYDSHDLWAAQPNGRTWLVTHGDGRAQNQRLRYVPLDPDAETVDLGAPLLLSTFDTATKASGFSRLRIQDGSASIESLVMGPVRYGRPVKAKDAALLMFSRESYTESPDLWVADLRFSSPVKLSDANPQQANYLWGTAELVHWTSTDGERLEGILYKPDGFDASVQYPMMVYFYERSTDGLHAYHAPAPGRSVINRTFYASRGYLVFVPDIPYKDGYPGESAMNAVMPGVTGLIDQGFVDPQRVGVQGHSWGGYQIAYMVTRTNLFAAAEAGAPVANMFSAYGGIRWQTGLSRMFQYERTQSRIGGSIWEKPLRYIENSPLFWLDKVETPLLIMHNDADGHVPWYQGIELFVALRRLGKPAWLINYNGEPHWPLPYWKRMDWTTRMQQFFDHYLMDAPAPVWLEEGVPAVRKGEDWGLELVSPPADGEDN